MFRRRSRPEPVLPGLDAHIDEHLDAILAETDGAVPNFIRALAAHRLWQASPDLPLDAIDPVTKTVTREIHFQTARTTMPDGRMAANVSTSAELALARTPGAIPYARPGIDILREVVESPELHGVVVNPAARWQVLKDEWIAAALPSS